MARQASVADPETEARRRAEAEAAQKRQQELEQQVPAHSSPFCL